MRRWLVTLGMLVAVVGCSREPSTPASAAAPPAQPKLGIRPHGDTEIQTDMAKIQSEELKKVFAYIDEHVDEHVVNLQKWIRQPSISNSGEGIPETAEMVKGFFDQLGCQESRVYDVGITEWGAPGNPVVYARCDEGAPRTIAIYWQYDTMPVTQPDAWIAPPFEGADRRAAAVQEGPDRPRRGQQQRAGAGAVAGADVDQGGHRQAAGQHRLRRRRRRGADGHRPPQVRQGSPRLLPEHRCPDRRGRDAVAERRRRRRRRIRRLRLLRADDQRQIVGARAGAVRHPRIEQAVGRQPGVAPHEDAGVAHLRRRQHAAGEGLPRRPGTDDAPTRRISSRRLRPRWT